MKKIFFSLLAIGAIASCAKTEDVFTEGDSEIKLAPVTALQTKANVLAAIDGINYPTAENFDVYGYWKRDDASNYTDGDSFFGGAVEFTNKGNYWGGVQTYYWPKNGTLRFAAYSPSSLDVEHNQVDDTFTKEGYVQPSNTAETWDFLVAPTSAPYTAMTAAEKVAIQFEHALSWITLKVVAKDAAAAANVFTITNITINDVNTTADFEASMLGKDRVEYESWTNWGTPEGYVVFDGEQGVTAEATVIENTAAGTLVIPQETTTLTVTFDQAGVNGTIDTPNMTQTLDLVLDDSTPWVPGKHYVYTLVFGLDEILINPSVSDWEEVEVGTLDTDAVNVSTAAQLEAALANEKVTKITFQANIAGKFVAPEVAGRTLTIDGNGFEFDGAFQIDGKTSYKNATTVFQNINFVAASTENLVNGDSFIYCGTLDGNTNVRYPDSVTIQNCTFTATGSAAEKAVAAKFWSLKDDVTVENVTANGLHSLMQLTSCGEADVDINKVTITNGKNGISLGDAGDVTISNSNIVAKEYGIRANGCVANTSIVNTTIEATQPVIVRNVTVDGYVLNIDEKTVLTTEERCQVIFTAKSDDVEYVAPTAQFTCNAPAEVVVFPKNVVFVEDATDFAAALANADALYVDASGDIDNGTNGFAIERDAVLYMNGADVTAGGKTTKNSSFSVYGEYDVTINDANITGGSIMAYYGATVELNNTNLTYNYAQSGRNLVYVASDNDKQAVAVINGGTYDMVGGSGNTYVCAHGNAVVYINGGTFTGKGEYASNAPLNAIAIGTYKAQIIISGGTFDFDPSADYVSVGGKKIAKTATIADGYKVVKNGSVWTVVAE